MRGTSLLIYIVFAVLFNTFTVYMTFDFMHKCFGSFDRSRGTVAALVILDEIVFVIASIISYPAVKVMAAFVLNVFLCFVLYRKHSKVKFYYVLIFTFMVGMFEYLFIIFLSMLVHDTGLNFLGPWRIGLYILFVQTIIFTLYRFFMKRFNKEEILLDNGTRIFNFLLLPVFSVLNIGLMIWVSAYILQSELFFLIVCDVIFIIFLNIYFVYLFNKVVQNNEMKKQLALRDQASDLQYRYYQEMEQRLEESRKTVHDMKNHLQAMERLYQTGESERGRQYGDDLRQLLNSFSQDYYTDNRVLNIVINDKVERGKSLEISVSCALNLIDLSFMREMDITTIFANLLDNAVEAAGETKPGWIRLKADQIRDFIVISVENSARGKPSVKNGQIVTTKKNHHGYGLENVRQALEHYNGHMRIETGEDSFKVSLFIPTQMEEKENG